MSDWLNLVRDGDLCAMFFTGLLLIAVAQIFAVSDPRRYDRGVKFTIAIGILFAGASLWRSGWSNAPEVMLIALRTGAVFMVLLGPIWLLLSAWDWLANSYCQVRATFVARATGRRMERERRKQEAAESERKRLAGIEWERTRPARELAAKEAAERTRLEADRRQKETQRQADEQRRREDVRYKCRLLYDRYAAALKTSMSPKRFDEYLATYLSDRYSSEEVEGRGIQLQAMLLDIAKPKPPARPRRSLSEIQSDFTQRRTEIAALSLDEDAKAALIADLNREEDKAIRGAMQS